MRRVSNILIATLIVALLALVVIVGFWGMRLLKQPGEMTPTVTQQAGDGTGEGSLESRLTKAIKTVDALQKTATALTMASTPVPGPTATTIPSATATPIVPTSTQLPTETAAPAETNTPVTPEYTAPPPVVTTVLPASAAASSEPACSQDSQGNRVCYPASNVIDGEPATTWRESMSKNPWIEVELSETAAVTGIVIVAGYDKIDPYDGTDRWPQNHRPRHVRVHLDDVEEGVHELADTREWQEIDVQPQQARRVRLVIVDSYPPREGNRPYVAVSEIRVLVRQP